MLSVTKQDYLIYAAFLETFSVDLSNIHENFIVYSIDLKIGKVDSSAKRINGANQMQIKLEDTPYLLWLKCNSADFSDNTKSNG